MFSAQLFICVCLLFIYRSNCDSLHTQILEARQLYPFRAYKDVQLFHYTVRPQVSFASFQYKANGSVHCPIKRIAVYLQYGSYPVMSLQNASYPDNFAVRRLFLHNITLLSDTVPVLINITNPFSGNWYAAAFLIENNDRIAQKGLFTPCFSWLSSSAKFHIAEDVISILQNTEIIQKIEGLQTYRFFGLKNSWLSTIQITNCSRIKNGRCAAILTARPLAIPFSDGESEYFINCTLFDICSLEMIPAIDNWNYVSIQSLDDDLEFSLVIKTAGCSLSIFPDGDYIANEINSTNNTDVIDLIPTEESLNNTLEESCWPKIPLVRISLPTNLAFEYNLPADEEDSYPFILNITNSEYSFTSFEVLPIVDIGGTLVIELAISPFMNYTHINVSVFACLIYGVRPAPDDIDCAKGIPLSVNTTTKESTVATLFVPYPEAGTWYLRLLSQCFNIKIDNSSFFALACDMDKTAVFLRIRSTPCILGQCGAHGTCYQYVSGGLIFSTCNCIAGWKGWGCTDNSTARTDSELMLDVLLLTLSNLLFIPAIILSIYRRYFTEAFIYFATMVSSSFYHACDAEVYSYCLIRLNVLQFCDFYLAILSVWITFIAMAKLPNSFQSFIHMAGAVGVSLGVEYDRTGLWVFVLPTGIGLVILLTSWAFSQSEGWPFPHYYGSCGRIIVEEYAGLSLTYYENSPWEQRMDIAYQLLQISQMMTENTLDFALYMTDLNLDNFAVRSDGTVLLIDVENIVVVDRLKVRKEKKFMEDFHRSKGEFCKDCLNFSFEDLCYHDLSDHNYYAVCKGLLVPHSYYSTKGLLHGIPPHIEARTNLSALLKECADPTSDIGRFYIVPKILQVLKSLL